ncbi:MAG: BatA domain-containing protein [Bacteroidales bacterium]|nr:BatA domain-containing protein [Bacteroidales bacterium]MDD4738923.1 BatA domain-containing protein [Bacteroidales bacterium]
MHFINPFYLFGLLAIAIPIIIHLFNFRRFKKVYFTNVKFLKEVEISTKKQNKIRNRLLLFTRILSIILLVLLFAQPFFPNKEEKLVEKGLNAVVVFVDNSFSMQNQGRQGRLLDEAKQNAKEITEQYNSNDLFLLLTMDLEGRHQQFVNKDKFIELLNQVEISPSSEFNSKLISRSFDLLNTKHGFNKRIFFVSDFQAPSFDVSNFPKDSLIRTLLVPLNANNIDNIYVDSISFVDPIFQVGQNIALNVRIVNKSEKKAEKVSVKLFINNKQISVSSADIDKNQSQIVKLNFTLKEHGIQQGRVSIIDNPITFDDDFYFTLQTTPKLEILSINSNNPNPFIARLFSNNNEIEIKYMSEKTIDFNDFDNYSFIILNELNEFSSGLVSEIKRFREQGGDILIVPSEKMNLQSFQNAMQSLQIPYFSELIKKQNKVSIINQNNKLYKGVFSQDVENIEMPTAKQYYKLSSSSQTARESIMKFQSQDDFLLVSQENNSKAYVFSTNLTEDFTDFVKQSLFVPTIWNMALFSQVIPLPYYFFEDDIQIDISKLKDSKKINVAEIVSTDKKVSFIPELKKNNRMRSLVMHNQTNKAGNYNIEQEKEVFGGLSLNYNRMESNLSFMDANNINSELKKYSLGYYNILDTKKQVISSYFTKTKNGNYMSIILLILLLLSVGMETYLLFKKTK